MLVTNLQIFQIASQSNRMWLIDKKNAATEKSVCISEEPSAEQESRRLSTHHYGGIFQLSLDVDGDALRGPPVAISTHVSWSAALISQAIDIVHLPVGNCEYLITVVCFVSKKFLRAPLRRIVSNFSFVIFADSHYISLITLTLLRLLLLSININISLVSSRISTLLTL